MLRLRGRRAFFYARTALVLLVFAAACVASHADTPQPVVGVDEFHINYLMLNPSATWKITALRDELVAGGYAVREIRDPISGAELADCDVLLVTTPQDYYDYTELDAIASFVSGGGGVLFCSNYGTAPWSPICQEFAQSLGFSLDNNSATDMAHNSNSYEYWISFTGSSIASGHPLTKGVSTLQSYRTSTLVPSANLTSIASTDSDAAPPSRPTIQACNYGAGRVIVSGSPLYFADPVPNRDIGGGRKADMLGLTAGNNRRFAYNAITWLAGASARPLVSVSLPTSVGVAGDKIEIDGTVCDAGLASYKIEYRPSGSSGAWTQLGQALTSCVVNGKLGEWNLAGVPAGDYSLRVTAANATGGSYSATALVHVAYALSKISDIAAKPDGAYVRITDKEITTGTDDLIGRIYVEETDRSSGICVLTSAPALRGSLATVTGIHSAASGVHALTAVDITTRSNPSSGRIAPVGVSNRSLGPKTGASTAGLLVKAWGRVVGPESNGFTISDGSGTAIRVLTSYAAGTMSIPANGSTVAIIGAGGDYAGQPAIIARQAAQVLAAP